MFGYHAKKMYGTVLIVIALTGTNNALAKFIVQ